MLNLLSYLGVTMQSELCLWTLLGLIRTIFDATLFKVNANLKQVWQMSMPMELSMSMQRFLRTIISGVMLVQCFTVYVYLASYIVLLYPVFLEERPNLVLPWLLLAAIRNFLCELTSLAAGLGTCVLLGPARPSCIRFVVFKVASITPAFYMWLLVYGYYNYLKIAASFKLFPAALMGSDHDYGLELAVRRRRTKSLQGEDQLRKKLVANLSGEGLPSQPLSPTLVVMPEIPARMVSSIQADLEDNKSELDPLAILTKPPIDPQISDLGAYEDYCGNEIIVPRDADRILEQFAVMMLRIAALLKAKGTDPIKFFSATSNPQDYKLDCTETLTANDADTLPLVSTKGKTASYLQNYPQIFMKKPDTLQNLQNESLLNTTQKQIESTEKTNLLESVNSEISKSFDKISDSALQIKLSSPKINQITADNIKSTKQLESTRVPYKIEKITSENTIKNAQSLSNRPQTSKATKERIPKTMKADSLTTTINKIKNRLENIQQCHRTDDALNISQNKRKSDSEIINKGVHGKEIERYIKEVTDETFESRLSSFHQMPTSSNLSSNHSTESIDSLKFIMDRMKKYNLFHGSSQQDETEEVNSLSEDVRISKPSSKSDQNK